MSTWQKDKFCTQVPLSTKRKDPGIIELIRQPRFRIKLLLNLFLFLDPKRHLGYLISIILKAFKNKILAKLRNVPDGKI